MLNTNNTNPINVSQELLLLLRWLVEHEQPRLRKLVTKALKDGLLQEIHQATGTMSTLELQDLSSSIDDFIVIVDSIVYDEVEQEHNMPVPTVMLKPTIQAIDHLVCDTSTISTTVAKTLEKTKRLQEDQAKKILYQELLKNWRPTRTQGN